MRTTFLRLATSSLNSTRTQTSQNFRSRYSAKWALAAAATAAALAATSTYYHYQSRSHPAHAVNPESHSPVTTISPGIHGLEMPVLWNFFDWIRGPDPNLPRKADMKTDLHRGVQGPELPLITKAPQANRIIAIGDVHGDIVAFRKALRLASLIDLDDNWIGGDTVLVQVGDQLDRGDHECAVINLLFKLQDQAPSCGGRVYILLGNHEIMNSEFDFRYVTPGGFKDFEQIDEQVLGTHPDLSSAPQKEELHPQQHYLTTLKYGVYDLPVASSERELMEMSLSEEKKARALAMKPGGVVSRELGKRAQIALILGDVVFVHAGLRPAHVRDGVHSIEKMNQHARLYLKGEMDKPAVLKGSTSPIWIRDYSRKKTSPEQCAMLSEALQLLSSKSMVVGHTPQAQGINAACSGQIWRIDTGMSAAYGGPHEVLEITRSGNRILTEQGVVEAGQRSAA